MQSHLDQNHLINLSTVGVVMVALIYSLWLNQYGVLIFPFPHCPLLKRCILLEGFCVCGFNNVPFKFPWMGPTIACWPILTPFEHHLQSVTVLDNERDLPIVWSFQALFSIESNGFQMEELAAGRRQSGLLFLRDFGRVSLSTHPSPFGMAHFYRRWQTFWQVQYALNCCVR